MFYYFYRISGSCTGAIISKSVILTAAHCVERGSSNPNNVFVKFGHSDLGNALNMTVKSIVKHPNLYGNLYEYKTDRDLALLKLSNDLEFNDAIQTISLPSTGYSDYNLFSSELIFAGYGFEEIDTEEAKKINFYVEMLNHNRDADLNFIKKRTKKVNNMKKIEVYLTMSEYNRYAYDDGLDDESILFSSTLGLWYGDSGGPLMKISSNSTNHVVIGIARGARFCSSGIANIYTRIGQYVPWIQKNLENFDEENIGHDLDSENLGWIIFIVALFPALTALALLVFYQFNSKDIRIHNVEYDEVVDRELLGKTDADALFLKNWAHKIFYVPYIITKLFLQVVKKLFETSEIIAALVIVTTVIRAFVKIYTV
jgi:hypothetical protein